MKKKKGIIIYNKPEKCHTRDFWLEEIRHKHYTYISKNKKKIIERKRKYKNNDC